MSELSVEQAAQALKTAARGNEYCDHGTVPCSGCCTSIDGVDMLADLQEAGFDLIRRPLVDNPELS